MIVIYLGVVKSRMVWIDARHSTELIETMGILGLVIQRTNGIPIISKTWTDKLLSFDRTDSMLIAGFMSAITSFANSFEQNIDFIQLSPKSDPGSNGISAVLNYFSEVMLICFTEPYLFLNKVNLKLQLIYKYLIEGRLKDLAAGNVFTLAKDEEAFIERILFDTDAKTLIEKKKNKIISVFNQIEEAYSGDVRGFSINSFDNSILFSYGIELPELQNLLCHMGKGGDVKDWEVQYKPVWIDKSPILVSYTNSAVKIPVSQMLGKSKTAQNQEEDQLYYGEVPLYYYIITEADCSIGPIMEKLNAMLHPLLTD
jgi:hypothetical protein